MGKDTIDEDINDLIEKKRVVVDASTDGKKIVEDSGVLKELLNKLVTKDENQVIQTQILDAFTTALDIFTDKKERKNSE